MFYLHVCFNVAIFHKVLRKQAILNIQHLSMSVLREQAKRPQNTEYTIFFSVLVVTLASINIDYSSIKFIKIAQASKASY